MKTMVCSCGKTIYYSTYNEAYNCDCGKCYNAFKQELRPFSEWKDDFFEGDDY